MCGTQGTRKAGNEAAGILLVSMLAPPRDQMEPFEGLEGAGIKAATFPKANGKLRKFYTRTSENALREG